MKRLRKKYIPKNPFPQYNEDNPHVSGTDIFKHWNRENKNPEWKAWRRENLIRYFMCGEYGEVCGQCLLSRSRCGCGPTDDNSWNQRKTLGRPHYHAILFNLTFDDLKLKHITPTGERLYTSETLTKLWGHGHASIGSCTFESAAYVARYCTKKITGDQAEEHYQKLIPDTGEILPLEPEYNTMSRNPGIAAWFLDDYLDDIYPKDYVTVRGKKMKPPKYYDKFLKEVDPYLYDFLKDQRKLDALEHLDNNTPERLAVRETVLNKKLTKLIRPLDA